MDSLIWYKQEICINKAPVKQSESGKLFLNSQYMTLYDHGSFLVILAFFHLCFAYTAVLFVFYSENEIDLNWKSCHKLEI